MRQNSCKYSLLIIIAAQAFCLGQPRLVSPVTDSLISRIIPAGICFTPGYFVADPREAGRAPVFQDTSSCSDYFLVQPILDSKFSFDEFNERLAGKDSISTEDQTAFLADNDVSFWLARVFTSNDPSWTMMERLGADVNVNFLKVISCSWYHNGRLALFIDDECFQRNGIVKAVFLDPEGIWVKVTGRPGELRVYQYNPGKG